MRGDRTWGFVWISDSGRGISRDEGCPELRVGLGSVVSEPGGPCGQCARMCQSLRWAMPGLVGLWSEGIPQRGVCSSGVKDVWTRRGGGLQAGPGACRDSCCFSRAGAVSHLPTCSPSCPQTCSERVWLRVLQCPLCTPSSSSPSVYRAGLQPSENCSPFFPFVYDCAAFSPQ